MTVTAHPETISPLRAARQRAGLSIEQLAVKAGISRATVYWAERAPQLMSERTLKAVCTVLHLDETALRPSEVAT